MPVSGDSGEPHCYRSSTMNPLLPLAVLLAASFLWGLSWLPLKALERLGKKPTVGSVWRIGD